MAERHELIHVGEAAARIGLTDRSFRRRLAEGEIDVYRDNKDRRRRLVREADLDRLVTPIPLRIAPHRPDAA